MKRKLELYAGLYLLLQVLVYQTHLIFHQDIMIVYLIYPVAILVGWKLNHPHAVKDGIFGFNALAINATASFGMTTYMLFIRGEWERVLFYQMIVLFCTALYIRIREKRVLPAVFARIR